MQEGRGTVCNGAEVQSENPSPGDGQRGQLTPQNHALKNG